MKPRTLALFSAMTLFAALGIAAQTFAQNNQPTSAPQTDPKAQAKILDQYGKLPLSFEANHGQTDARVKFLSRTGGYTLFLTGDEAVLALSGSKTNTKEKIVSTGHTLQSSMAAPKAGGVLRMKLLHANPGAKVTGTDELPATSNYFIGNDPKKWRSNVPTYAKVKYEGIYSGIDLVYYGNQRQLEYDFIVAPGADPHRIQFKVGGAKGIHRDENGDLVLQEAEGELRLHKPLVYQEKDGTRQGVDGHYVIKSGQRVGFEVAVYDARRPLVIDPVLVYSTYLGGSDVDAGEGIAVDSSGNAYVTGFTISTNFPTTTGAFQTTFGGGSFDAFVTKLNATGSALVYSTYLGGDSYDAGAGIAVDSSGNAYVTGYTVSTNFPTTTGAFQTTLGGYYNAFVTKLNPTGSALVYSTYLGGSGGEKGYGVAVDSSSNAYVTGFTGSTNFPTTTGAFQTTFGGGDGDAFMTKLNPAGSALVYSTYLGGSGVDVGLGIGMDSSGNAYVTGFTISTNFPTTTGAFQTTFGGGVQDAFVTKLNPAGSALVYSTYLGGSDADVGFGIGMDSSGNAYVTGFTYSTNFPTTTGAFQTTFGGGLEDAFVTKLNPAGSALVYSTYLGGGGIDQGLGIAVDSSGNAYVTGDTGSTNFPTTTGAFQTTFGGGDGDAFVTKLNPAGSALVYSTYLGGSNGDTGVGIAVDSSGNAYVTGGTGSTNFPTTTGAFQTMFGGGSFDAFVTKIRLARYSVCLLYDPTKGVHSGATIPIKLQLCDSSGNDLSSSSITVHAISITQISTSTSGAVENAGNSNPSNDFRFDATLGSTGGYIFNLKTTGLSTGTYKVNFTVTGDSFVYAANFEVN